MPKEKRTDEIQRLVSLGRQKGQLTYKDLNQALPAEVMSSDQLHLILMALSEMNIEVLDVPGVETPAGQEPMARMHLASKTIVKMRANQQVWILI